MRLDQCCCLLPLQELLLSQNGVLRVRSETWFPWITWISKLIWTFCPCTLVLPQTLQFYFQWCVHRSPSSLSDPGVLLGGPCLPTSLCIYQNQGIFSWTLETVSPLLELSQTRQPPPAQRCRHWARTALSASLAAVSGIHRHGATCKTSPDTHLFQYSRHILTVTDNLILQQ